MSYQDFLTQKRLVAVPSGFAVPPDDISRHLFPFQRDLVRWSLAKGRAALFATTGMGKTRMQLEWARHVCQATGGRALILAPLAVGQQTIDEGRAIGITVTPARRQSEATPVGITITNYEMVDHFDASQFVGVVMDESSILKAYDGKTRTKLIETFSATPYRLCCTATPAPNDQAELANHAEFLGIMSRVEMLAAFFVHDDEGWRLKGHAQDAFYRWLASWSMSLRLPSDLGYPDDGYILPPLTIEPIILPTDYKPAGMLFATGLKGITDRAGVRRDTLSERVQRAADSINADTSEPWIAWVGLNDEGRALAELVPDAVLIEGHQSPEVKTALLGRFLSGEARVLITKLRISGFGLNLQHCARMVFVGLGDSYEQYFQGIRRCYRFGQTRPVVAQIILTEPESVIVENVRRKEQEAEHMAAELVKHVAAFERSEIGGITVSEFDYQERDTRGDGWHLMLGDSAERLTDLPDHSIDFSIFSPPFQSLYTYSPTERDLGNSRSEDEFWQHFSFISSQLRRLMKPGRNICVHVAQLGSTVAHDGVTGIKDFRGATIRHFLDAGFVYHGDVTIDKDPQAQAIRTHSKALLFVQLKRDASWLRPALADYILVFRAPGVNETPIHPDIDNNQWIEWARPIWYGIRESDTLNVVAARSEKDERHICPLQLGTIERCIRLWSNKGETVLSPFAGIGSELYQAIRFGRQAVGCELKPEYYRVAVSNLRRAEAESRTPDLFALAGVEVAGS